MSWRAVCALAIFALLAGCGDSDDGDTREPPIVGPLPTGPDDARAYSEDFVARNPRALARFEHLVMIELEPTAEGDEKNDTCAERAGVDCIPYVVDEPTLLTLAIDESAIELERLVLRDRGGPAVLSLAAGGEPVTAVIAPGEYVLEFTHAFAGDAEAETPTIFLRPGEAAEAETNPAAAQSVEAAVQAGGVPATTPPRSMSLTAGRDCVRCSFANSDLTDQHFDGANLTGSTFRAAKFLRTTLRGATLIGCTMTDLYPRTGDTYQGGGNLTDRFDADFSGVKAPGVHFSFFIERVFNQEQALPFFAIFRGATLDDTLWDQDTNPSSPPSQLRPDFRNASLRGAHFSFIVLTTPAKCPADSRARDDACSFQGADLTAAVFDDVFWNMHGTVVPEFGTVGNNLAHCSFGVEPGSKRATVLHHVTMETGRQPTRRLDGSDFSGADLTDAFFEQIHFDDQFPGCGKQRANLAGAKLGGAHLTGSNFAGASLVGADLSGATLDRVVFDRADLTRAKLPGAKVPGVHWRGTILTEAVIAGMIPATFNDLDLTGTDFTGVDFAGFDLTHTDFSPAVLSIPPSFGSAKLSDGTRGVNIAGHKFPPRYELFKGANLSGVDFSRTELLEAVLEGTTLNNAKLVGANLNFANLRGAKLRGATLGVQPGSGGKAATLRGAFMPDIDLSDADLRSADLTGAHLYGDQQQTLLVRTRLDSASFVNAICSGAHFSGTMSNTVFVGAQLVNTVFNGATLDKAKFDDAYLEGADFSNATSVNGVVLSNAAVSAVPGTWQFREQDGTPFIFRYEATKLGALATDDSVTCPNGAGGPCCPSGDVAACLNAKLKPARQGPFPPVPECVPKPPKYDNCITPRPTVTPAPTPTPRR